MRRFRRVAGGAVLLALLMSACGPGASSQSPTPTTSVAGTFVFGGPPECPQRPFCLLGLEQTYGLHFKEFKPLDVGGPITVEALANNEIQVGLLFTSDPTIKARNFVILQDDKGLQRADNLVPIINAQLVGEQPMVATLLNSVSAKLTQDALVELNRESTVEHMDARDIASAWLASEGLLSGANPNAGVGIRPIVVGKTNFYEQDILSELYAQILEANGFTAARQDASGSREVVFPALESGQIDVLPEYAATALEFVNGGAGQATADAATTTALLRQALTPKHLTALDPAAAADQNAIVVTQASATQYGLTKISDLGKPAP